MNYSPRAVRERDQYNKQVINRSKLNKYFAHANILLDSQISCDAKKYLLSGTDKNILEIGCQGWKSWIDDWGISPRELHCINISEAELSAGINLAQTSKVKPYFHLMDAHDLKFTDKKFDLVFGRAILHHLDLDRAMFEISRVLKPNGLIIFSEPLNINPLAKMIRYVTPNARTLDEHAFNFKALHTISSYFYPLITFYQLFSLPLSCISVHLFKDAANPIMKFSDSLDQKLVRIAPFLKYYYRYSLIVGNKKT